MKKCPNVWLDLDLPRTTAFTFNDCQLTYLTLASCHYLVFVTFDALTILLDTAS